MKGLLENIRNAREQLTKLRCRVKQSFPSLYEAYSNLFNELDNLWIAYGRRKAILESPFLHTSILISLIIVFFKDNDYQWYTLCTTCLPSILGMSITGYALILNLGSDTFRDAIRGESKNSKNELSPFMITSSSFAYFLIIQATTLTFAMICSAIKANNLFIAFIGTTLLIYSIILTVASILNTFFLSRLYDKMPKKIKRN